MTQEVDVVVDLTDDDDDFTPPVPIRASGGQLEICPSCSKPLKKHGVMELLECAEAAGNAAEAARDWYMVQTRVGHEAKVKQAIETRFDFVEVVRNTALPGYVMLRCELDHETWQSIKRIDDVKSFVAPNGVGRPTPLPQNEVDAFLETKDKEEPPPSNSFVERVPKERVARRPVVAEPAPEGGVQDAWTSEVPFPTLADGEVDYEALVPFAAAMRTVLERERDEIIRKGGPIEKQNIELKQRLAQMLDDLNTWRRRAQTNAESRNMLQKQVDDQTKTIRQLRNELKGRKESGNHTRLVELPDILKVVQSAPGWEAKRGGNGHWQFLKNGVFVTDAAGSGGSTKVNMATRVKLRKAGLEV